MFLFCCHKKLFSKKEASSKIKPFENNPLYSTGHMTCIRSQYQVYFCVYKPFLLLWHLLLSSESQLFLLYSAWSIEKGQVHMVVSHVIYQVHSVLIISYCQGCLVKHLASQLQNLTCTYTLLYVRLHSKHTVQLHRKCVTASKGIQR